MSDDAKRKVRPPRFPKPPARRKSTSNFSAELDTELAEGLLAALSREPAPDTRACDGGVLADLNRDLRALGNRGAAERRKLASALDAAEAARRMLAGKLPDKYERAAGDPLSPLHAGVRIDLTLPLTALPPFLRQRAEELADGDLWLIASDLEARIESGDLEEFHTIGAYTDYLRAYLRVLHESERLAEEDEEAE